MFKTSNLLQLVHFLVMFSNDKPSDWLLVNLVHTKVCRFDKNAVRPQLFLDLWCTVTSLFRSKFEKMKSIKKNLKSLFKKTNTKLKYGRPNSKTLSSISKRIIADSERLDATSMSFYDVIYWNLLRLLGALCFN